MPDRSQLERIVSDPASTEAERAAAQRQLAQGEPVAGDTRQHLEGQLLQFAQADRLEDIPPAVIVRFVEGSTADPKALKSLCADWHLLRPLNGFPVAEETWNATNRDRAAFERLTQRYPFLGPNPITLRLWSEDVEYLRTLCEQNGAHTARRYFVPRIRELLERLPDFAFAAWDDAKSLLEKYEGETQ